MGVSFGMVAHQLCGQRREVSIPSHTPFLQLTNAGCCEAEGSLQGRGPSIGKGPEAGESLQLQRTEERLMCLGFRAKCSCWGEMTLAGRLETLPVRS